MGTPSYFAPEICEDKPYNSKIDVWSMGVVLYELLALAQPFAASNVAALIMKIVNAEPPPLPEPWRDEVREAGTRLTGGIRRHEKHDLQDVATLRCGLASECESTFLAAMAAFCPKAM